AVAPADSTVIPPAPPPGRKVAAAPGMAPTPAAEGPMLLRVGFGPGEEVLTPGAQTQLAQLAKRLAGSDERINVKAYAAEVKDGTAARRLSLSRALAVRRFLGDQNVAVARINVTALGAPGDSGPADRVDIVSIGR
ncbi:OmpA family protein, partial [Desertibaculum subflavum]|uniref:OmpA family protein n=1 Tax=Desertibaculum subflavum TaxID=2268458 RepID=UPI0013C509C2